MITPPFSPPFIEGALRQWAGIAARAYQRANDNGRFHQNKVFVGGGAALALLLEEREKIGDIDGVCVGDVGRIKAAGRSMSRSLHISMPKGEHFLDWRASWRMEAFINEPDRHYALFLPAEPTEAGFSIFLLKAAPQLVIKIMGLAFNRKENDYLDAFNLCRHLDITSPDGLVDLWQQHLNCIPPDIHRGNRFDSNRLQDLWADIANVGEALARVSPLRPASNSCVNSRSENSRR